MIMNTKIEETLRADGSLILDEAPSLPVGRVRVALRSASRVPDSPWLDESVSAPFDLPRQGVIVTVHPRSAAERLPQLPIELMEE